MQSQILPSRAALVDRIALQFEYGQNLIALLGPSGLGKSYLLETFITDKYSDFNKAFVQVTARMTDSQLMSELLDQSFSTPLIDQQLSLSENFFQLVKKQNCGPCLWVLDGARHLSDEMAADLALLAKNSPTTLYILVAAQAVGQFSNAVEIHLEPLSMAESKQLMHWFFNNLPVDEDPVFQTFLKESHGNPSLLLAWQPIEHSAEVKVADKVSWRLHLITLMIIIMLLIIGLLYKSDMTQWWQEVYQQQPVEPVATAISVEQLKQSADELPSIIKPAPSTDESKSSTIVTTEQDETHNNVAAILDSLAVSPKQPVLPVSEAKPTEVELVKAKDPVVANLPFDNAWFNEQDDEYFVIQLLAVTKQAIAEQFIVAQKLGEAAKIYQTQRNNKNWWIVTYGNYKSLNAARKVTATLPEAVRNNQPFYKKISKIKQEIALLDQ
ncbi:MULTISPECIES: AAA family ATPase [unclassified Pseudoalteromonas]|uniref:AAA family ATPase n=1 Tax=unclassified Pseudoalteromonas TaxID=194690 RepID=UPI0025B32185|nr:MULTISPECIES: AAA family ATPase [unclassified Pseudoalteromonas]MDN3379432.1 AAA family ATPase [Pseudoalteromonas sp. APC 3893]MDN3386606.1 AAA family ATPase [Pseudoalteromonas sp. APC 4017]